jgi:hypothetical protein
MELSMDILEDFFSRREMYYNLSSGHSDDFANTEDIRVVMSDEILQDAVDYITVNLVGEMRYPGKSYAIAMLYAHWLEQLGAGPMLLILSRPDLLNNDDPHFTPLDFSQDSIYMKILEEVTLPDLHDTSKYEHLEYLMMTRKYFLEEFMLTEEQREIMPFIPQPGMSFVLSDISSEKIKELSDFWLADSDLRYWVAVDPRNNRVRIEQVENEHVYVVGPNLFHSVPL